MKKSMSGWRVVGLVLVVTVAIQTAVQAASFPRGTGVDVTTWHNDNARDGANLRESVLTPDKVTSATFGKLMTLTVDGKVDAQPLILSGLTIGGISRNVVFVATEHDSVYAFDADTGSQLWKVSMLGSGEVPSDTRSCSQVTPEIGITSTPVIDRNAGANGTLWLVAMSKNSSSQYFQRLHALDVTTGADLVAPHVVTAQSAGSGPNSSGGVITFKPASYKERSALLLVRGKIYTSWASHCDIEPYNSWVMSFDGSTLAATSVLNLTPNGTEGAFWNAGAGPAADVQGNVYHMAGNGTFDPTLNSAGMPSSSDYGNAFVKLTTRPTLAVNDYFTMYNTVSESNSDADLGSGGLMLLPDLTDASGTVQHLMLGAGKDGQIYVVNRDNLGKFESTGNAIWQQVGGLGGGEFAAPAFFGDTVYYGAVGATLRAFPVTDAKLATTAASHSVVAFPYPGATPSVSADGKRNGIVWAVENSSPAVLFAYPADNLATELYDSNQAGTRDQFGAGNKFIVPVIANGKVYVGTQNSVAVFGLLSDQSAHIEPAKPVIAANEAKGR